MTTERDLDRLTRAWLDLMPNEAPDRVIDAVLHAVDTTPQVFVRRPLVGRGPTMHRLALVAALATALLALVGGLLTAGGWPFTSVSPTPQPTLAPSIAPTAPAVIPVALRTTWSGIARDVPGQGSLDGVFLTFTETGIRIGAQPSIMFLEATATMGAGTLVVETTATAAARACVGGDIGRYGYRLGPNERVMTIELEEDDCAARAVALAGRWFAPACRNPLNGCLGDLDPGTYPSQFIDPRLGSGSAWAVRVGLLTYTVPEGWANSHDYPSRFKLTPSADYALEGPDGPAEGAWHEIFLFTQPAAVDDPEGCTGRQDDTVERTVEGLAAYVQGLDALETTTPEPVTIDGHAGVWLDVRLAPDFDGRCEGAPAASIEVLTSAGQRADPYGVGLLGAERVRLYLLDLGGGDVVGIVIDSSDPARFDALVEAATPIVESLTFADS